MKDGWQAPLFVLAAIIVGALFFDFPIKSSSDAAAWVQAIGSVGAILTAVWVFQRQYQATIDNDKAETRAFVLAIRAEIETVWHEYSGLTGKHLRAVPPGAFYDQLSPSSTNRLMVYANSSARVGKIDNDRLRKMIVQVYAGLAAHFESMQLNSRMLEEFERFAQTYQGDDKEQEIQRKLKSFTVYTESLKISDLTLQQEVFSLQVLIDAWLAKRLAR
jgi:hypothetical protein